MLNKLMGRLKRNKHSFILYAHLSGEIVPLNEVEDEVFSSGMLGEGVAIEPTEGKLYSPCSGVIEHIFDTKHALNIVSDFGSEILLHIGLDTVKLKGKGFEVKVSDGERVTKGDLLCVFDMDVIRGAGLKTTTPMVVCNSADYVRIETRPKCSINAGDSVIRITK